MRFKKSANIAMWLILICVIGALFVSCRDRQTSTENATKSPTDAPTENLITEQPTEDPTEVPTDDSTVSPTENPTEMPTQDLCEHVYDSDCDAECNECGELRDANHLTEVIDAVDPTCTENGRTYGSYCGICSEVFKQSETIPALGHEFVNYESNGDATCTADGSKTAKCTRCEQTDTTVDIGTATGHDLVTVNATEPTCVLVGRSAGIYCSACDYVETPSVEIPALGHEIVLQAGREPTCTEHGWEAYVVCDRCDYSTYSELSATGHALIHYDAKAPTCVDAGWQEYDACNVCDFNTKTETPALGHDIKDHEGREASCTDNGWNAYKDCTRCDYNTYSEIPSIGHNYIEHNGQNATCTEYGWSAYRTCSRCDFSDYNSISALGHEWSDIHSSDSNGHWQKCIRCDETTEKSAHQYTDNICRVCGRNCDHTNVEWSTVTEASCTAVGKKIAVCLACGVTVDTEVIQMTEHIPGDLPTCTTDMICTVCGYIIEQSLGHITQIISGVEPTCTQEGYTQGEICTVCGELVVEPSPIPMTEHTEQAINGISPTCTQDGVEGGVRCSVCGKMLQEQKILPALGHKEIIIPAVEPTCMETGFTQGKICQVCGELTLSPQNISPLGHDVQRIPSVFPTCTQLGLTEGEMCKTCGETLVVQETIDALGHDLIDRDGQNATCTEIGWNAYQTCSRCEYSTYSEIPALGHDLIDRDGQNATCTEIGWNAYQTCSRCEYSTYSEIPALGHDLIDRDGQNATCTEIGWNAYQTCSRCEYSTYSEMPALGHDEKILDAVSATCTQDGLTQGIKCNRCKEILKKQETIPSKGHSYPASYVANEDDHSRVCDACGYEDIQKHQFTDNVCNVCGYIARTIKFYELSSVPNSYKIKGHSFDYVMVDHAVIATSHSSPNTNDIARCDVEKGLEIRLQGWIGFSSKSISHFAIFFDGDIYNAIKNPSFKSTAEQAVIDAGGEYRFSIFATTEDLQAGEHTVSFAVILTDGTYVIMKDMTLNVTGTNVEFVPDDEIVKAEKEEMPSDATTSMTPSGDENGYIGSGGIEFTAFATGIEYLESSQRFNVSASESLIINVNNGQDIFSGKFNRFKIAYSSSAPLKVIITYREEGKSLTDIVYFEAGENMLFTCLTQGYLSSKYSTEISSIEIQALGDREDFTFALYGITTESVDIIGNGLTYIENERYKLGIKLSWGGGVSYILDKQDGNQSLGNVINNADTGRLVQQSYYGTNNTSEYEPGTYGSTVWNYNPVQGGNVYNQASRIIDVVISAGSIYIKAQPRDWAKTELTPSYMENVYTVYSDRIQVDNRFTDYAGFKTNPSRHQELPAFYTVGYLNTFKFYNGTDPWTGDELQVEDSLAFWGGNSNAYFKLKRGNTETWCAWMNKDADYGIGLYTPNIDILLAGRHGYESDPDTVNPASGACSYVAPLNSFKIVSYEALEYSYLIATGSTEEIRDLFTEYKDFADNSDLTSSKFAYSSNRVSG